MEQEIELLKQLPNAENAMSIQNGDATDKSEKHVKIFRTAFLCVGLFLLIYGFISGGTVDVLTKAINICTECIGLG